MNKSDTLYKNKISRLTDSMLDLIIIDMPDMTVSQRLKLFEVLNAYRLPKLKSIEINSSVNGLNEEQANEFLMEYLKRIENAN